MRNKINLCITIVLFFFQSTLANIYYVSTTGNDTYGDGSSGNPWRTLKHAASKVPANQGHTIQIAAGTFIEGGQVEIPLGVNIEGAGKNLTIIKSASSFYYNPASPGYATDKYLISLNAAMHVNGNQSLKNFTIDGDSKQLHGGVYVRYRSQVIINGVSVQNTNFNGIWLWDVKDSKIIDTDLINCSWGSTGYCSGALNLGNLERVEIDHLNVDESVGYGIKAIGPNDRNNIVDLKIHDSRISVNPYGLWENGKAPNIAIELWSANLTGCEIYNSYVDNTISLVNSNSPPSTGVQAIRVHHNTIDMETRAKGAGYGIELSIHDAEIDHNYFIKGRYGIAHWDNFVRNWDIHHNVFYALGGVYPGDIVRSQKSGLHNVNFYNNTIEFTGDKTMNIIGLYGGASKNVNVINNLFINNNTAYSYYPNSLIRMENGAVLNNLAVKNNVFDRLIVGSVGGTYSGNLTGDPKISKAGSRPEAYYMPMPGSPLIDAGLNVALSFLGLAPDIGAYEYTTSLINLQPQVSLTSPANNSNYTEGSSVRIAANASDTDGTITKVEFFQGTTKLGEDFNSPYTFAWNNAPAGSYSITAKATDNQGAVATSGAVVITVTKKNQAPIVNITSPANNANFARGSTVTITANATDTDGTISKVEFFVDGITKPGEDLTSPYSFDWANVAAGDYSLTAKTTDNQGATTTSGAITIIVKNQNQAPTGNITSPENHASFTTGSTVTIAATASDTDGTISKVEFSSGTTKLGEDLTSPYSFDWTNVAAGTYSLTAKATDMEGETNVSSAVSITVGDGDTFIKLGLYAPDATLAGNMKLTSDPTASKGSYFSMPAGYGTNHHIPPPSSAQFNFELAKTDTYVAWVRLKSPSVNTAAIIFMTEKETGPVGWQVCIRIGPGFKLLTLIPMQ